MKKYIIILSLVLAPLLYPQVTQNEAAGVAVRWFSKVTAKEVGLEDISRVNEYIHKNTTSFYSFNFREGGFVLVSADKRTSPILGYSIKNYFHLPVDGESEKKLSDLPESSLKDVLTGYAEQIEIAGWNDAIVENGEWYDIKKGGISSAHFASAVEPLTESLWGQGYPYNIYCPLLPDGRQTVTHCGATAMAILLRYHKYPSHGIGSVSYDWQAETLAADFQNTFYDYDKMPSSLTNASEEEARQVAQVSYHCGLAQFVNYNLPYSYSRYDWWKSIPDAFELYFGYQRPQVKYKSGYTSEDFNALLKNELDNGRPIFYCSTGSGGHFWIVDGYDNAGYFHMNWGWNGNGNGYFTINNLVVGQFDFNPTQTALVNIAPNPAVLSAEDEQDIPNDFQLKQNYPNPFNPSTAIQYTIPAVDALSSASEWMPMAEAHVILRIYDALGRHITTLVDKEQSRGTYNVMFNAGQLSSGVYFYTLETNDFVRTRKLILLK